ncbi:MAG: glycosyl hydrolase family 28-related protein [Armatimonadota bacterium]
MIRYASSMLLMFIVLLGIHCPAALALTPVDGIAINVLDYGAKADGITDSTEAFQKALDSIKAKGGIVYAPAGYYRFAGHIRIPTGVSLQGSWQGPPSNMTGTVLEATEGAGTENGDAFITLESNALVKGMIISYPNQPSDNEKPIPYPWTIRGLAQDCQVMDIQLIRSYKGIDFGTYPCSRHYINNLYGSVLSRGIYVDGSVDVSRINNVHFSVWGCAPKLAEWRRKNLEVITIGRSDWMWITNFFCFEASVGLRLMLGKPGNDKLPGPAHYIQISNSGFDMTTTPIIVEECENLNISQSVFKGGAIQIRETNTYPVTFNQCSFSPIVGTASLIDAKGRGRVSVNNSTFEFWDTEGSSAPAFMADCASVSVQNCEFGTHNKPSFVREGKTKKQIELTPSVQSAVITGNRLRYGKNILNKSKGNVVIRDNVVDNVDLPIYEAKPVK